MAHGKVELRHVSLPLKTPFETSFAREVAKDCVLVKVQSDGLCGWGEAPVTVLPLYSSETVKTAWHVLVDFLIPLLSESLDPRQFAQNVSVFKGHQMAKAGLEAALWDLKCERDSCTLSSLLGGTLSEVEVGVSVGLESTVSQVLEKVEAYLHEGYRRVKLKIKPCMDYALLKAFRLRYPEMPLQADANCGYAREHVDELARFDELNMLTLEQPFPRSDLRSHQLLQEKMTTSICLDESVASPLEAKQALELGACRNINVKPARVGGFVNSLQIHSLGLSRGAELWVGGMLETGVGRLHNLALASLPGFTLPGDISASSRYFERDILKQPVTLQKNGKIGVPQFRGGVDSLICHDTLREFTTRQETVSFG